MDTGLLEVFKATKIINRHMEAIGAIRAEITQVGTLKFYDKDGKERFYTPIYQDKALLEVSEIK